VKVILLQDSKDLGKKGAVVNVSDGYARNYLFPRSIATEANESNMKSLQEVEKREDAKVKKALADAKAVASHLKEKVVTVRARAGETGRLFGSVTAKDIADAIQAQFKIPVDKRRVELQETVKSIGLYTALLSLHQNVEVQINVKVVSEED